MPLYIFYFFLIYFFSFFTKLISQYLFGSAATLEREWCSFQPLSQVSSTPRENVYCEFLGTVWAMVLVLELSKKVTVSVCVGGICPLSVRGPASK